MKRFFAMILALVCVLTTLSCGMGMSASAAVATVTHTKITHCYSAQDAADYADKYAMNYNSNYPSYANSGGDCANFASQALFAGGLKTTTASQTTTAWSVGSTAWTSSSNLRHYMDVMYGSVVDNPSHYYIARGNLVFYRWKGVSISDDNTYHHTAIGVGNNSEGVPVVSQHSYGDNSQSSCLRVPWDLPNSAKKSVVVIARYGDADGNGKVNTTDARLVLQYAAGRVTANELDIIMSDVDRNGKVDTSDAQFILSFAAGRE